MICGEDRLHFETVRELLDVERRHRLMVRRSGLFGALESALARGFYDSKEDATYRARRRKKVLSGADANGGVTDADLAEGWVQPAPAGETP